MLFVSSAEAEEINAMNVRKIVFDALLKTELSGGYSNLTLDSALKNNELSSQDKRFGSALFYGVIERKLTLDWLLEKYSSKKLSKLSPLVLVALRMGLYQIVYMEKVPDMAAVNESVKLIKASKEKYASGFVNAILRSYLREPQQLPEGKDIKSISIRYSCPEWLVSELTEYLGESSAQKMLEESLEAADTYIRINNTADISDINKELEKEGISVFETELDGCLRIEKFGAIEDISLYKKGLFHVQDMASQLCLNDFAPRKGERLLDVCSAPGGKTFTAAELMENTGEIIACDLHPHRVKLIENGAERLCLSIISPLVNDASKFNESFGEFDKIICDVPCSGFGDIGRKPEIKYKNPDDLTNLPNVQYNILRISADYLKSGGKLLYSTCTLRRAENEAVVERFLENNDEFELVASLGGEKYIHLIPGEKRCDGFFYAILRRK